VNELDRNLLTGEEVVFETTKHWFAPIRASLIAILIILGALVLRWLAPTGDGLFGSIGNLMDLIAIGLLLFAILWIVYNIAEFLSAHFGVTNMRVLRYEGLLRRRSSETLLPTLTDVRLDEPALGRMLGFGNLKILTASGAAGEDNFMTVAKAKELRTAIQEQKASALTGGATPAASAVGATTAPAPRSATAAPAPAPATSDTASALAALDSLKTQGLITEQEYQAKRSEILGRI
jgi:membrane protein YdbS with pleckstrin-like domain